MDPSEVLTGVVVAVALLLILGVAANTTVCVVMFRSKRIWKNRSSFLIFHLSIADLLFRFIVSPLHIRHLTYPPGSEKSGTLFLATQFVSLNYATVIFVTLTLIALERYTSIAHPLKRLQKTKRNRRNFAVVAFIWTYSLAVTMVVYGVFEIASLSDFCSNTATNVFYRNATSCDGKIGFCVPRSTHWSAKLAAILYLCFGIFLPVIIMITLYAKIINILWRRSRSGTIHGRVSNSMRKSLHMLVIIVCGFLFCWMPTIVIRPLMTLEIVSCETELVLMIVAQLTQNSSSIINPVIYAVYSKDFFNECRKICCFCTICRDVDRRNMNTSCGITLKARKVRKVTAVEANS